ncbi:MAG: fumarylacetoacetate hydrolase family protein [Dehalococcoidia bacterium]|jgi:2-oxo-3-hexenedioate decarboxylase/2-keto-4-pentenoate hydratase|nr:fumarylacetoacetate hydrolase family protein [Dehalococcoidia bacterium]
MDSRAINSAASALAKGRLEPVKLDRLPEAIRPSDEVDAYLLQAAVRERLSAGGYGDPVGRKIGCTTAVMQEFLQIPNPCAGFVYGPTVRERDGEFDFSSFHHVGVECEVVVRLGHGLPASGAPYDRTSVAPAVEAVMAGIEVVDDRWADYRSMDVATLIADDFFGAGCVLGDPVAAWRELDLESLRGSMSINGVEVGQGIGGDIMGHPFEALAWLADTAVQHDTPLQAGEFIFLGSIVETKWLERGDIVEIDIEGLGRARARFT